MQPKKSLDFVFHLPKVSALRMSPTMFAESQAMFPKRSSNVPRRSGNAPRKPGNDLGKPQNVPGRSGNVFEGPSNVPGRSGNVSGRSSTVLGRSGNVPRRSDNVPGRSGNVPMRSGNVPGRSGNIPGKPANVLGSQAMFLGCQAMFPDNISKPNRTLTLTLMDLPEQMTRSQNGCSEMGPIMPHSLINYSRSECPILVIWIFLFSPNWSQQCLLNVHSNWAQLHQVVSNEIGSIGVVLWSIEQLTTWIS